MRSEQSTHCVAKRKFHPDFAASPDTANRPGLSSLLHEGGDNGEHWSKDYIHDVSMI